MITTERLLLKPLDPTAAAALLEPSVDRAERIVGARLTKEFLATAITNILPLQAGLPASAISFGVWLIIEPEPAVVVGSTGFMGPPDADGEIEIGFGVVPSRQRRGYLTEAGAGLLGWGLAQPGVTAVRARCDPDNLASIHSLERLGFSPNGHSGDYLSWRLTPATSHAHL